MITLHLKCVKRSLRVLNAAKTIVVLFAKWPHFGQYYGRLEKVKQIEDSTLIIHGKQDPLIHVRNAYYSHDIIANSDLVIIENMGHLIEEEVFEQFKEDLVEHLKVTKLK